MASTTTDDEPVDEPPAMDGTAESEGDDPRPGRSLISLAALAALALVGLLVVFNVGGGSDDSAGDADGLEQFDFETVDGGAVTLATYEGQPIVLNFFASWCGPCRAELPAFEMVHQEVKSDGVVFLGVSRDNDVATWQSFVAETAITYDTVYEGVDGGSFEYVDAKGMPTTVFISADGTVAEVFSGLLPEATLREKIDQHLLQG